MKCIHGLLRLTALAFVGACASPRPAEFLVITFTPSIETEHYRTWDFELESCLDFDDPRIDPAFVRENLLASNRAPRAIRGDEPRPGEPGDCRGFYEQRIAAGGDLYSRVKERSL